MPNNIFRCGVSLFIQSIFGLITLALYGLTKPVLAIYLVAMVCLFVIREYFKQKQSCAYSEYPYAMMYSLIAVIFNVVIIIQLFYRGNPSQAFIENWTDLLAVMQCCTIHALATLAIYTHNFGRKVVYAYG